MVEECDVPGGKEKNKNENNPESLSEMKLSKFPLKARKHSFEAQEESVTRCGSEPHAERVLLQGPHAPRGLPGGRAAEYVSYQFRTDGRFCLTRRR